MPTMKLSMGRPIVSHPHYEDAGLRERTKLVYSMYSRMSEETVKGNLMKLGVDFFVLEDSWCTRRTRPGCSMPEIWDIEDPLNVGKIPLCTHMSRSSRPHFTTVFSNDIYKFLKVPKAKISDNTVWQTDSVFAGAMPTMKLSTGRPIVNHPHYEDAGLRSVELNSSTTALLLR